MEFNVAQVFSAVAAANPDRDCIVFGSSRWTYRETDDRARRLARALHDWGLGAYRERAELDNHESGQHHVGLYLTNCNEYLETMLGAYLARAAPFNINYRYVTDELTYLMGDAKPAAIFYHAQFAPTLARTIEQFPQIRLVHVNDHSGNAPLPGAVRYEDLLATFSPEPLDLALSPDDLHLLYTGGTTGMPKGVLWRQHDIYLNSMGGRSLETGEAVADIAEVVERSQIGGPPWMTSAPLMHGSAQWAAFICLCGGRTFVMSPPTSHFDADLTWQTISHERVGTLSIVGDAFGRPLAKALETRHYELSNLTLLASGGAALSVGVKNRLLAALPHLTISEFVGSSETGSQLAQVFSPEQNKTRRFAPIPGAAVVNEEMTRVLSQGDTEIGWIAQQGLLPLGYLGDENKTARTFPVIDGIRHSIPGDRARWHPDGTIELLGRDSMTINSGGEKIFAEEVEAAIGHHRDVYDVIVVAQPSPRLGSEVVALVQLIDGAQPDPDAIVAEAARHIARYKLPNKVLFLTRLQRSPSGKPDYRWAKTQIHTPR